MRKESLSGEVVAAANQNIKERDFWLDKLSGKLERACFPYDHSPSGHESRMEQVKFTFSGETFSKFMQLCKGLDYTLHMILVAGVTGLLEKYTGSSDIMLAAPIYKQKNEGRFINTLLVLRHQIDENASFKELLMQARQTLIEATQHQNYPIETLLYKLNIQQAEGEFPLSDVAVLLDNIHDKKYIRDINLNMIFSFSRTEDSIDGIVEYNSRRFLPQSVEQYVRHLVNFFDTVLFDIDKQLNDIEILSQEDRRQLLHEFNDSKVENRHLEGQTIHSFFTGQAKKTPGNTAVLRSSGYPGAVGHESLNYEELDRKAGQLARVLIEKGVPNHHIIGIMVDRSPEMIVAMLGVLKAGAAYLPIDSEYPPARIEYLLRDSNAKLLLTRQCMQDKLEFETHTLLIDLDSSLYEGVPLPTGTPASDDVAYIIYTSGSTGKPKGVVVQHRSIVNTLDWRKNCYRFDEEDRVMQIPSFSFDSSVEDIFTPLISGSTLVLMHEDHRYNVDYIKEQIQKNQITHFLIVPSFYKILLQEIPGDLRNLRNLTVAGEGFTEALVRRHFQALPHVELFNEYGPTENSVCTTLYKFGGDSAKVLIGKPINNVSCFILDRRGNPVPAGVYGELCVSGAGLARGYLNNPLLTAQKFVDNPFFAEKKMYRTGDIARWRPDGNIEFSGRSDHQVKIRGYRIEPGEIEERLIQQEDINDAVVVVKKDENGDHYLCAYFISNEKVNISALRDSMSGDLPDYMIPAKFMQLDSFPLLVNGKVDRNALPEPRIDAGENYIPPRDELEKKLVLIWGRVLGVEPGIIGIDTDFFSLGGHSLKATILASQIHKEFNKKIPLVEIFKASLLKDMANYIRRSGEDKYASIKPVADEEYYPLSSAQNRLFISQQLDLNTASYNITQIVRLDEAPEKSKLEHAFRQLIQRHESLRTSFQIRDGRAVQKIAPDAPLPIRYFQCSPGEAETITGNFVKPFDLSKAPLIRIGLLDISGTGFVLMVDMHHIISDGVSHGILVEEFIRLYEEEELPPLRLRYRDYAVWQQREDRQADVQEQEKYWLETFQGDIPILELPTDHPRPDVKRYEGGRVNFSLDPETTRKLNQLTAETGTTLFMLLIAVYSILLSRYSRQQDIVIGTPITGRNHADLENIIGMFVNMLAIRTRPQTGKSFRDFLSGIKEISLGAFENQDYQFEDLVARLNLQGEISRNPLFDVVFAMQNISTGKDFEKTMQNARRLKVSGYDYKQKISKFDLLLEAAEFEGELILSLEYSTILFKPSTAGDIVKHFTEIVQQVVENSRVLLEDIQLSDTYVAAGDSVLQEEEGDFLL